MMHGLKHMEVKRGSLLSGKDMITYLERSFSLQMKYLYHMHMKRSVAAGIQMEIRSHEAHHLHSIIPPLLHILPAHGACDNYSAYHHDVRQFQEGVYADIYTYTTDEVHMTRGDLITVL